MQLSSSKASPTREVHKNIINNNTHLIENLIFPLNALQLVRINANEGKICIIIIIIIMTAFYF